MFGVLCHEVMLAVTLVYGMCILLHHVILFRASRLREARESAGRPDSESTVVLWKPSLLLVKESKPSLLSI